MNALTTIKQRMKKAKKKVAVAVASAGTAVVTGANTVFAAVDTSATGEIGTAIAQAKTDYEAIFGMVIAAIVLFWALSQLKKVFFGK